MSALYEKIQVQLEKTALNARMEQDIEQWPGEVLSQAYRQIPYLTNYELDLEFEKTDASRGYAVGKLLVYPMGLSKQAAGNLKKLVSLPVIIRNNELSPFDVFTTDGNLFPLEEEKFQAKLLGGELGKGGYTPDSLTGTQGPALSHQLTPPSTSQQWGQGMFAGPTGLAKTSSQRSLLKSLEDSLPLQKIAGAVREQKDLNLLFSANPHLNETLLRWSAQAELPKTAEDRLLDLRMDHELDAILFQLNSGSVLMKLASADQWPPLKKELRLDEAQGLLRDNWKDLLTDGYLVFSLKPLPTPIQLPLEKEASAITEFTKVALPGDEGVVFPYLFGLDGTNLNTQLFVGKKFYGLQEKIAAHIVGPAPAFQEKELVPSGLGVFFVKTGSRALAFEPVVITHRISTPGGESLLGHKVSDLVPITFQKVAGLQSIEVLGEGDTILIPADLQFLKLPAVCSTLTPPFSKEAAGELYFDSGDFVLRDTLSPELNSVITSEGETLFRLCTMGASIQEAKHLIKEAKKGCSIRLGGYRKITRPKREDLVKKASLKRANLSLPRINLFKEVGILARCIDSLEKKASHGGAHFTKETIDTILSLNFLTPENAQVYLGYLPELEKAAHLLAELVTASRLGLNDVQETAAKNAMTQLTAVIGGLSRLGEKIGV